MEKLPYFDFLLAALKQKDETVEKSFGRHVHWGYWKNPAQANLTVEDYAEAAENLSKQVITAANISQGMRILDAGCGFGGTLAILNETLQNMDLQGVNIDSRQIVRAKELVIPLASNTIEFITADACDLPLPDNHYDGILAVECIFHFPSRERFFAEANRVLKPSGRLALSDFIPSAYSPLRWIRKIRSGFFGTCQIQYTLTDYKKLAQTHGFEVKVVRDITLNTLPTYRYLNRLLVQSGGLGVRFTAPVIAFSSTLLIQLITRLRLLNYFVLSFEKVSP